MSAKTQLDLRPFKLITPVAPPDGSTVETKIYDWRGPHDFVPLTRRGELWFYPQTTMQCYYQPTHWREILR